MWRCAIVLCLAGVSAPLDAQTTPRVDPDVVPAQMLSGPITVGVSDPPTPQVRLQVRTPATIAPGKEIPYKFIITNVSSADAYKVTLRCPIPANVLEVTKAEPKPTQITPKNGQPKAEYVWNLGTLKCGAKQEIELSLKPNADVIEISTAAHVTFEYGQVVITKIDVPKLKVDKQAPEKVSQGEKFPIRVIVSNIGKVPVKSLELVENISPTFQFVSGGTEGERTEKASQRIWKLGTLGPGQRQVIEYFVKTDGTQELLSQSVVKSVDVPSQEQASSTTKILTSAFSLDLTGPQSVNASDPAKYEIKVTNTGSLPIKDLRVSAALPKECTLSNMTDGGKRYKDSIEWLIPDREGGPLKPGQAYTLRFSLKGNSSGVRTIRAVATAEGPKEQQQSRELKTSFEGSAVLKWSSTPTPLEVQVNSKGTITIKVQNQGSDTARNVKLQIDLPPEVQADQVTPKHRQNLNDIIFDPINLPANGQEVFTITYRAIKAGRTTFKLRLYAEGYENDPLRKDQEIVIRP
jgi:hypothetical protein